jgi:hypothetical protein
MERGEGRGEIGEYRGGEGKDDSLRSSPEGEGAGGWATQRRCVSAARERERARVSFPTSWLVGNRVERSGLIRPVDNQTAWWTQPGQFGPWIPRPGKRRGTPRETRP